MKYLTQAACEESGYLAHSLAIQNPDGIAQAVCCGPTLGCIPPHDS